MYPVAIACGNTFVLKPSEKVPLTSIKVARLFEKAGLPKGVLNLVHGGREVVDALLTHPKVKATSFVGSTPVARHIYETGTKHGKRVQANGGAKNFVLLMPDADVDNSVRGIIEAAFGCAGERCMAGSTAVVVGTAEKTVLPALVEATKRIKVGPTDREPQPDMGAVITRQHRDRVVQLIETGLKEGARLLCGRNDSGSGSTRHDCGQRGSFRSGVKRDAHGGPGCGHRACKQVSLRQWRFDLYPIRQGCARIQASDQVRHGGHQHRCAGFDGVVSVQRLE
jgi:acyl-CoA reductase-like NAD-dependent aldehyde dehydrogenase